MFGPLQSAARHICGTHISAMSGVRERAGRYFGRCAVLPRWSLRGPAAMVTARSCRDGSLRGPAAMVAARSCRDGRCAALPRWSLRGPAAMVAARSCRDGSLRGLAAMAHCAVLPRWSLRGPAATCFPIVEAAPPPLRRVPPAGGDRMHVSKSDARALSPVSGFLSRSAMPSATCQG